MKEQRHESFRTDSGRMEESVAEFLRAKMSEEWIVKRCSCRETTPGDTNTWVGCMFEGEKPIQGF
ncbi:MAG: hypothetical protein ACLFRG_18315 [Desulfococcaceae bacterium]